MQNKIALILSDNNLTVLFSSLLGAVVGGAITIIANIITNINSQKLEKAKNENESRAIEFLCADAIKQSLIILEGSFGIVVNNKTKYGYLENSDTSLKYIMKMLDDIIPNTKFIKDHSKRHLIIQIYTELKLFLDSNELYRKNLDKLRFFRKENIDQKQIWNINLMDYFSLDEVIHNEEQKKEASKINPQFFKYQQPIIAHILNLSNGLEFMYNTLVEKMEVFLETINDRK